MEYYFAPMEGVTGAIYRTVHHKHFLGVDKYYMPFISPTQDHLFTQRELRNIAPEENVGFTAVPQLLTKNPEDFLWAARELFDMGYEEVNLNLGCPSGTVTAKGKGAGMLAEPEKLDCFLETVYAAAPGPVSLKTRLGVESSEEFPRLLEVFSKYPVALLIVHPRVRQDFYKHPVRMEEFSKTLELYTGAVCYNGGLVTPRDCEGLRARFPQVERVMLGQGLMADPALVRRIKGGPAATREELRAFHDEVYHSYLAAFRSQRNTVYHMKEFWSYLGRMFEGTDKPMKRLKKATDSTAYESAVAEIFGECFLRENAAWGE